jgi:hypothetical protein
MAVIVGLLVAVAIIWFVHGLSASTQNMRMYEDRLTLELQRRYSDQQCGAIAKGLTAFMMLSGQKPPSGSGYQSFAAYLAHVMWADFHKAHGGRVPINEREFEAWAFDRIGEVSEDVRALAVGSSPGRERQTDLARLNEAKPFARQPKTAGQGPQLNRESIQQSIRLHGIGIDTAADPALAEVVALSSWIAVESAKRACGETEKFFNWDQCAAIFICMAISDRLARIANVDFEHCAQLACEETFQKLDDEDDFMGEFPAVVGMYNYMSGNEDESRAIFEIQSQTADFLRMNEESKLEELARLFRDVRYQIYGE